MLDRLLDLEPGTSACAERHVTAAWFPQVYLVECIAQLGGIVAIPTAGGRGWLASLDHVKFHAPVSPGDTLIITARLIRSFGSLMLIEGEVRCSGRIVVRAQLTLAVGGQE